MHKQWYALRRHFGERWIRLFNGGYAGIRVGRGARRIQLHSLHETRRFGLGNFFRRGRVGQIQGHQWFETRPHRARRQNAFTIRGCGIHGGNGRSQIRHDDRPRKLLRGMRHGDSQCVIVTQMDMPIVGLAQDEFVGECVHAAHFTPLRARACLIRVSARAPVDTTGPWARP